jgi:hypothetical protein
MPARSPRPGAAPPAPPAELTVAITKHADGSTGFRLTRADGSATWQRTHGATGTFFPPHDLTHHAVETVLGHRRGFYGLVAEGWELGDFGAPWPRGRLDDVDPSELIVGFLDRTGLDDATAPGADELNAAAKTYFAALPGASGTRGRWRDLTDDELARVRARARELVATWRALPAGETLTLPFTRAAAPGPSASRAAP